MKNLLKKKENKLVKSFGISVEASEKIDLLSGRHDIPKSQLIENIIMNINDVEVFKHEFRCDVEAVSKQGAKFGYGKAYKEPKVAAYEYVVGRECKRWWKGQEPLSGPIRAEAVFTLKAPKTTSVGYARKDLDNMAKALLDAVKGIVMVDDSQLVELNLKKEYGDADEVVFRFCQVSVSSRWKKAGKKWKWE